MATLYISTVGDIPLLLFEETVATHVLVTATFPPAHMQTMLTNLATQQNLTRLDLEEALTRMSLENARTLSLSIQSMPYLRKLSIRDTPLLGIQNIQQLCLGLRGSSVVELDLCNIGLGLDGCMYLSTALKGSRVQQLAVAKNNIQLRGASLLLDLNLSALSLDCNNIHPSRWHELVPKKKMRLLSLADNFLTLTSLIVLARWVSYLQLTELNVAANPIQGEGLARLLGGLATSNSIVKLNLAKCELVDKDMLQLRLFMFCNGTLQRLMLRGNFIGERGYFILAAGLLYNHTIKFIDLPLCTPTTPVLELMTLQCLRLESFQPKPAADELAPLYLTRLLCKNQDLSIQTQFWQPRLHKFFPVSVHYKMFLYLLCVRGSGLSWEVALHILTFWKGV